MHCVVHIGHGFVTSANIVRLISSRRHENTHTTEKRHCKLQERSCRYPDSTDTLAPQTANEFNFAGPMSFAHTGPMTKVQTGPTKGQYVGPLRDHYVGPSKVLHIPVWILVGPRLAPNAATMSPSLYTVQGGSLSGPLLVPHGATAGPSCSQYVGPRRLLHIIGTDPIQLP